MTDKIGFFPQWVQFCSYSTCWRQMALNWCHFNSVCVPVTCTLHTVITLPFSLLPKVRLQLCFRDQSLYNRISSSPWLPFFLCQPQQRSSALPLSLILHTSLSTFNKEWGRNLSELHSDWQAWWPCWVSPWQEKSAFNLALTKQGREKHNSWPK